MGNGIAPPVLYDADYETIKSGSCISGGTYDGCIKVGTIYYWLENGETYWILHQDSPDANEIVKIPSAVWALCQNGGTYSWNSRGEYWVDASSDHWRWGENKDGNVYLKGV